VTGKPLVEGGPVSHTAAAVPRRIRLAHIFSSDLGIRSSLPFVAPLRARNWEITFITPEGPDVSAGAALGYRWLPLGFTRRIDVAGDAAATARLAALLAREKFDVVHTHNFKVSLVGRVLAGLARVPVILHTIHGITWSLETPEPWRTANALLERVSSVATDLILAQSQADRDAFVEMKVAPEEKVRVIGNGIDLARFDPDALAPDTRARLRASLGIADDETLALFPGRMVREKGIDEVYAAARLLAGEKIRVVLAGRDDAERGDPPSSSAVAGALVLGERKDMGALYAAADIVGLASWREGMPRVLMEAAAMGKPAIATDIRGCRDIVRPGVTGELTPVRDPGALAAALSRLAQDPARRRAYGAAARREAAQRFDVQRSVARVVAAYDELLEQKVRSAA
jgi:glycosyltransferase involved in cell wall biosynthesis